MSYRKFIQGVAVNDADYKVTMRADGTNKVIWRCPYYTVWASMITRCFSDSFKSENTAYIDCTVCAEWLTFSNFRRWMESQDWQGKELDKDLLVKGNKHYSPENCIFISATVNSFIAGSPLKRGSGSEVGVCFLPARNKFLAQCSDPEKFYLSS